MATTNGSWMAVSASVRGASHDRTGLPNQDAHAIRLVDGPAGGLVVAVADGHGGARYVRSGTGSAFAVDVACDLGTTFIKHRGGSGTDALVQTAETSLVPGIVEAWRRLVRADLEAHPLTKDELERSGDLGEGSFLVYGSTLLVALVWGDSMLVMQLGDGDLVVVFESRVVDQPVPDDPRLVAGETTSLGLPDAVDSFRLAAIDLQRDPVALVLLSTDGYGNSFADPDWPTDVGLDLLERVRREGLDNVGRALPAWLAESALAGGDDVTMALVAGTPGAVTTGVPTVEVPAVGPVVPTTSVQPNPVQPNPVQPNPVQPNRLPTTSLETQTASVAPTSAPTRSAGTSTPTPRRRGRIAGAAVIALVLVLVGGLIGRALGGDDSKASDAAVIGPDPTAESPVQTTETTTSPSTPPSTVASDRLEAIVLANGVVEFYPSDPTTATYASSDPALAASKSVFTATRLWDISSGSLVVKAVDGRQEKPVVPSGFKPGGVIAAGGDVWLASTDGTQLLRCDAEKVGCGLQLDPIAIAGGATGQAPEQTPGTTA